MTRSKQRDKPVESSGTAGYSGTPLARKLGIRPGASVALVGAPEGFESTLALPPGVTVTRTARRKTTLTVWFVQSRSELERRLVKMAARADNGGLWIAWPKKASKVNTDVSETIVRERGLAIGLVDFKVCAVDGTWSGLRFSRRKGA